ncbi:MAG: ArsA family ATPase [Myxococcales bacterium]|nr:ArsA family ATPase [Myxococcales bacterium]
MTYNALANVLDASRVLVLCGSGGVGKTTTSAALAVTAARRGRKVLVLTIDPAQRLLQALGLHGHGLAPNAPHEVLPKRAADLPADLAVTPGGSLHAMMLDAESGAIAMVERLLPDKALRSQVLGNRVYRAFLPALQASPDYIALELIASLAEAGHFDLVVLDTPPMHNALDFLHAGGTLSAFINERVLRWFAKVPQPGQKARLSLLSAGTSMAMAVLGKLFGHEALPDIAQFFASFQDVLPRLKERTQQTDRLLRSPATAFLVVTAPGETALREARHLHGVLRAHDMRVAGFIVNRVVQAPAVLRGEHDAATEALHHHLTHHGHGADRAHALAAALGAAARQLEFLASADEAHVAALEQLGGFGSLCTVVGQREQDIHTVAELAQLGGALLDGLRGHRTR